MSFGWSLGDVIAGLKAVYDVYQSVTDGPLNAKYEAAQFFDEFIHVISRLEDWEKRKDACAQDPSLVRSHRELRQDCTEFIKKHFSLIQHANPETKAVRAGRTTWLRKVSFTKAQIADLYRQVSWPSQRNAVSRLREKLQFFLDLAVWDIVLDTNQKVNHISSTHSELIATNHRLVASHLDLVQSITANLKRQTQGIDYAIPFERALHLPSPISRLLEGVSNNEETSLWSQGRQVGNREYAIVDSCNSGATHGGALGQEEASMISQRLENLIIRVRRNDNMETISGSGSGDQETIQPPIQHLLDRLKVIRALIGDAVGVSDHMLQHEVSMAITDPSHALRQELEAWDKMKERIEREILHPPPSARLPPGVPTVQRVWTIDSIVPEEDTDLPRTNVTLPVAIEPRPGNLSPTASYYGGWTGLSSSRSPGPLSSSPNDRRMSTSPSERRLSSQSRSDSTSSTPRRPSIRSDHEFQVHLTYPLRTIRATIRSISKNDEGDVQTISAYSTDGTKYRHTVDHESDDLKIETSMIPFVDNHHVVEGHLDQIPKLRVQFKGFHTLNILRTETRGEVVIANYPSPPIYKFLSLADFLEFQSVLLNKEVKHIADTNIIKSHAGKEICRVGSVRILLEPFLKTRHILYFQHMNLPSKQKAGFMEVPISHFKPPKRPPRRTLTLERQEGSRVSSPQRSRFGIRRTGSVNTIASFETSAAPAFARMNGQGVRGLVLEFYDTAACHKFWEEFIKTEPVPTPFE